MGEYYLVAELGLEPRISSSKGRRPTTRRLGNNMAILHCFGVYFEPIFANASKAVFKFESIS